MIVIEYMENGSLDAFLRVSDKTNRLYTLLQRHVIENGQIFCIILKHIIVFFNIRMDSNSVCTNLYKNVTTKLVPFSISFSWLH